MIKFVFMNDFESDVKLTKPSIDKQHSFKFHKILNPKNVDINILLNRIKINKKNEKKQKMFFFVGATLFLTAMTIFLYFLK
jgi:hypothetical protein